LLARFEDRLSFLYIEHARIDQCDKAIAIHDAEGTTRVPVAALAILLLGPGTMITHAAMRALADNNCLTAWVGEQAVRLYAHSTGGTRSARAILRQAGLVSDPDSRMAVVRRMYLRRFPSPLNPDLSLQQIRGMEGIRVRETYARASQQTGIPWTGRQYDRKNWAAADPVNKALSCANACLYGVVHAAILSAGYSAALGFIHTGKQLSFVYDIADLYKTEVTIPVAFETTAAGEGDIERRARLACRDRFRSTRLLQRVIPDIEWVLNVDTSVRIDEGYDTDQAAPGRLWDPSAPDGVEGGQNYGSDDLGARPA
jgi:CRISPR-associated protein Cas1